MLTADLVRANVRDGTLHVTPLKADARKNAVEIADEMLAVANAMVGEPLDVVREAFAAIERPHRLEKVVLGLQKLLLDETELDSDLELDPIELRRTLFVRAASARAAALAMGEFDRAALVREIAADHSVTPEVLERALFGDLRGERRLALAPSMSGEALVRAYELGLEQAVLLRAERIVVEVRCSAPAVYRALFRRVKFHRLLCTVDPLPSGAYRLTIDGPFSLFASTTRYGFELAMLVPLLRECDHYELDAVVRWGANKDRVHYHSEGRCAGGAMPPEALSPELAVLVERFRAQFDDYDVAPADTLVEVRGAGVLVPDLAFTHRETGEVVLFEMLGHWSRDAVWKRVELAPSLPSPIVFGVPKRLRVSEEVLPDDVPACLYVFTSSPRATAVHARLEALRARPQTAAADSGAERRPRSRKTK